MPLTPLFWPLVWNDFRELQLAGPFVLWAVQGVRAARLGWAAVGIGGMLACRQEYAVMVATFAFLPPRQPESLSATLRWRRSILLIGLLWFMVGFLGYLSYVVGSGTPNAFLEQFMGPKAPFQPDARDLARNPLAGDGGVGHLRVPGTAGRHSGVTLDLGAVQRAMGDATCSRRSEWHNVRYVMPMAAIVLAAGLIGYSRLANWLRPRRGGRAMMVAAWLGSALFCGVGLRDVTNRLVARPCADRSSRGRAGLVVGSPGR